MDRAVTRRALRIACTELLRGSCGDVDALVRAFTDQAEMELRSEPRPILDVAFKKKVSFEGIYREDL